MTSVLLESVCYIRSFKISFGAKMFKITRDKNHFIVSFCNTNRVNCFLIEELSKQLSLFLNAPGCEVSINFKGIDFIDSSGFNFLMILAKKAREHKFKYRLCHVSDEVRELFSRTDLADQILDYAEVISYKPCR